MKYPFVEEEFETIRTIIRDKASISRFGDGEFRCAVGAGCTSQEHSPDILARLQKILRNEVKNLLVGIPRSVGRYDWIVPAPKKAHSWVRYRDEKFCKYLSPKTKYYSAFITRTDSAPHIGCQQYWDLCKQMWKDRDIVIIQGEEKQISTAKHLFDGVKSIDIIFGPSRHAFREYNTLLETARTKYKKDILFILSIGVTATILAYDIHLEGYQALDIGHLGVFYNKIFDEKKALTQIEQESIGNNDRYIKNIYC